MSAVVKKEKAQNFLFGEAAVRVAGTASEPMFAAVDVCGILGLKNPTMVVDALDEDERAKLNLGRQGETWFVTESGLYHLIFKSRKAASKKFRRWVTGDVLPAIRKGGQYVVKTSEPEESDLLSLSKWLEELEVDVVNYAWLAQRLLDRARVAAMQLGFTQRGKREHDGMARYPREVLNYALGMVRTEAKEPQNAAWVSFFPEGFIGAAAGKFLTQEVK